MVVIAAIALRHTRCRHCGVMLCFVLDSAIGLDNPFHVVEVNVPETLMCYFTFRTLDFMLAVYIADDFLPLLNRHAMIGEIPAIPLVR